MVRASGEQVLGPLPPNLNVAPLMGSALCFSVPLLHERGRCTVCCTQAGSALPLWRRKRLSYWPLEVGEYESKLCP